MVRFDYSYSHRIQQVTASKLRQSLYKPHSLWHNTSYETTDEVRFYIWLTDWRVLRPKCRQPVVYCIFVYFSQYWRRETFIQISWFPKKFYCLISTVHEEFLAKRAITFSINVFRCAHSFILFFFVQSYPDWWNLVYRRDVNRKISICKPLRGVSLKNSMHSPS